MGIKQKKVGWGEHWTGQKRTKGWGVFLVGSDDDVK